jgi:hypothetical protein
MLNSRAQQSRQPDDHAKQTFKKERPQIMRAHAACGTGAVASAIRSARISNRSQVHFLTGLADSPFKKQLLSFAPCQQGEFSESLFGVRRGAFQ